MTESYGAIVVGASVGGLLTARALVDSVGTVLVLDRDALPELPEVRRCVGQGAQVHILLDRGRQAVEALLPGVFDEIRADGGLRLNFGEDLSWYHAGQFRVRSRTRFDCSVQTRPLLEHHLRRRVAALDGITLRGETRVRGLRVEDGQVRGVTLAGEDGETRIDAPIVIDAAGRGSQGPKWLKANGYAPAATTSITIGLGYASRMYRKPAHAPEGGELRVTYGTRSLTTRHGLMFEVEGGRWLVTLMGYHGDHPPSEAAGFEEWLRTLEHPQIAEQLADAEPISDVRRFKVPAQVRHHYERARLPEGFAAVGDAACALDPVFGQGMSVAAITAEAIRDHLVDAPFTSRAVARIAARSADRPWLVTWIEALRYRQAGRVPGIQLMHAFLDRVGVVCAHDPVLYAAYLDVMHLHRHAAHLFRPDLLWRILGPRLGARPALASVQPEHASQRLASGPSPAPAAPARQSATGS